ncbi:MAG TPA: nucleotidyl transferase AbiEii/AbiGii toxin family protein [Bacteroidales bacterium]|jgi:predicted nucleotidyltransferase component of viral defense system|nr:nucleotidyl transferase AbiEii/AbiGii toxin family protein [Bacteroidales bacterium]HQM70916.1 nucleotidyl transferase AbiEii/AbiGii toxin family protein [Bacteroidales bacterium]
MIPLAYLIEWKNYVPWKDPDMVEQDLVICKALVEIFNDPYLFENLAFRGGTALNKLYLHPQSRFSEDIDLVQIKSKPIRETIERLRIQLGFLDLHQVRQKLNNNTLVFKYDSENNPGTKLKLKIEINCREHFSVLGIIRKEYMVRSEWFNGDCSLNTYLPEELLGTKLRALYQRRKGRDLFDLFKAMISVNMEPEKILLCFHEYMKSSVKTSPTRKQFIQNVESKLTDDEFVGDIKAIIRPDENYNPCRAWELIKDQIIKEM